MLKKYMEIHGLTNRDVARAIGVSDMTIGRILNGHPISAKIGIKLCEAYGFKLEPLLLGY